MATQRLTVATMGQVFLRRFLSWQASTKIDAHEVDQVCDRLRANWQTLQVIYFVELFRSYNYDYRTLSSAIRSIRRGRPKAPERSSGISARCALRDREGGRGRRRIGCSGWRQL